MSATELEDLYLPFKAKRRTKASIAREAGLQPLADAIMRRAEGEAAEAVERPESGGPCEKLTLVDRSLSGTGLIGSSSLSCDIRLSESAVTMCTVPALILYVLVATLTFQNREMS